MTKSKNKPIKTFFSYCKSKDDAKSPYDIILEDYINWDNVSKKSDLSEAHNLIIANLSSYAMDRLYGEDFNDFHAFIEYHRSVFSGDPVSFFNHLEYHVQAYSISLYDIHFRYKYRTEAIEKDIAVKKEHLLKWIRNERDLNRQNSKPKIEKLVWKGSPSQLAFILQELVLKDFIQAPKKSGIKCYNEFAKICLTLFDVKTTLGTLAKYLSPDDKSGLDDSSKELFKIPFRKDLPRYKNNIRES